MSQLATYEVHPGQTEAWKKVLTEGVAGVFSNGKEQKAKNNTALIAGCVPGDRVAKPESTEGGGWVSVLKRQEGAPLNLG